MSHPRDVLEYLSDDTLGTISATHTGILHSLFASVSSTSHIKSRIKEQKVIKITVESN